jgi:type IV pilus assembly protein PilC
MVKIGEETGSLDTILESVSDYYDQETDMAVSRLLGLLEPVLLIVMAVVIGTILVSVMYPIFLLYQQTGR